MNEYEYMNCLLKSLNKYKIYPSRIVYSILLFILKSLSIHPNICFVQRAKFREIIFPPFLITSIPFQNSLYSKDNKYSHISLFFCFI